jgi:hypothetical protein
MLLKVVTGYNMRLNCALLLAAISYMQCGAVTGAKHRCITGFFRHSQSIPQGEDHLPVLERPVSGCLF